MSNGTDPKSLSFFKKLILLLGIIADAATVVLTRMTDSQLQSHIGNKEDLKRKLRKSFREVFKVTDLFVEEKEQWRKFYQKHFSLELNFADVVVPDKPLKGSWRLLIIAQGLTINQVYDSMSKAFKCSKIEDDLDKEVSKNDRNTKTAYATWVYIGLAFDTDMYAGKTLLEGMIDELAFFNETGNHLDPDRKVFCKGSRTSGNNIPLVFWDGEVFQVYWNYMATLQYQLH